MKGAVGPTVNDAIGGRLKTVIVCFCEEAPPLRQTVTE